MRRRAGGRQVVMGGHRRKYARIFVACFGGSSKRSRQRDLCVICVSHAFLLIKIATKNSLLASSRARSDFRTSLASLRSRIFLLTSLCVDSIHSMSCNKRSLQTFHEEWKGRIDQWQPRRKRRRKAARSTKQAATEQRNGDAMSVPKVFCQKRSEADPLPHAINSYS